MVVTGLIFVGVTMTVRAMGPTLPAAEAAFIRYVIGFLLLGPQILALARHWPARSTMKLFGARGLFHALGVILWFYAMARIPIAEVTAIGYLTPILVTLGAALFFAERLRFHRIMGVVLGFAGALIILRPGFAEVSMGQVAQLGAALFFAGSYLATKRLTALASPEQIVLMLTLFCTICLAPFALYDWVNPTWRDLGYLTLAAVLATAGHWTMTKALSLAPISVTQPATFLQLVWATLVGAAFFGEGIDPWVILGGAIIVGAATWIAKRESQVSAEVQSLPAGSGKWG